MCLAALFSVSIHVICFSAESECHYEPLDGYAMQYVANIGQLQGALMQPPGRDDEVYILFNTTSTSECVLLPVLLNLANYPRHLVGITEKAGVTINLAHNNTLQGLFLHNLTVKWWVSSNDVRSLALDNFTYLGCREENTNLKSVFARFIELCTDVDVFSLFSGVETGYLTVFGDKFSKDVTFSQSDYDAEWNMPGRSLYVRIVMSGSDFDAVVSEGMVTVKRDSGVSLNVKIAPNAAGNKITMELADSQLVTVNGTKGELFVCSVILRNVSHGVLTDEQWLSMGSIEGDNSLLTLEGNSHVPENISLKGNTNLMVQDNKLFLDGSLTIDGECHVSLVGVGYINAQELGLLSGSLSVRNVEQFLTEFLVAGRISYDQVHVECPVTVVKAIQPGTVSVVLDELSLWSHSTGVDLVFDLGHTTSGSPAVLRPIITKKLYDFWPSIPVNCRFEYGLSVSVLGLRGFVEAYDNVTYALLQYPNASELSGHIVFNYYASTDNEKQYYHGFTPESSFFSVTSHEEGFDRVLSVTIDTQHEVSTQLVICLSESEAKCPSEGSSVWLTPQESSRWVENLTNDIDYIEFYLASSAEINLSGLYSTQKYDISFRSETGSVYIATIECSEEAAATINSLSGNHVDVKLPEDGLGLHLDSLTLRTASFGTDPLKHFSSIDVLIGDVDTLRSFKELMTVATSIHIVDTEDYTEVIFTDSGFIFLISRENPQKSTLNITEDLTIQINWPAGYATEYYVTLQSNVGPRCTFFSAAKDPMATIIVTGDLTWPMFVVNGTCNRYRISLNENTTCSFPFVLDTKSSASYSLTLVNDGTTESMEVPDELVLPSGSVFEFNSNVPVTCPSVALHGSEMILGDNATFLIHQLKATGDPLQGNEVNGGIIDGQIVLLDAALLQLSNVDLRNSEIILAITSPIDTPTLILSSSKLPKKITIMHEFQDQDYTNDLKWYWANRSPVICWAGIEPKEVLAMTELEVVGTDNLRIALSMGTSSGRQCAFLTRSYSRPWTVGIISGFIIGMIFLISVFAVIVFKCSADS